MADRMSGSETEYSFSALGEKEGRLDQDFVVRRLLNQVRRTHPHLPDKDSAGFFLQNGSRVYKDHGGHPEIASPEVIEPDDFCRYALAGDRILTEASRDLNLPQVVPGRTVR